MTVFDAHVFDLDQLHEEIVSEKLAEVTASIAIEHFQWRYITLLFYNSSLLYGVNNFLSYYDKSVVITRGTTEPKNPGDTQQIIIFGQDLEQITHALDWMRTFQFDNTGRYIAICESHDCNETEAVETFWYHKITNVVFIKHHEQKVLAYTYFYNGENCAMSAPAKIDMDSCVQNVSQCVLFPEKFANLHKCPLIASTFKQPPYMMEMDSPEPVGVDGTLLKILSDSLNATLQIMTPHRGDGWGAKDANGTWLGSLGDIYYDLANLSITSAALTLNRFSSFQLSYNYNFVLIGWITNPTELESASLKLLHPFNRHTHLAVGFTFMLVGICSFFISSNLWQRFKSRIGVKNSKKNDVLFYSWMICMGMGLPTAKLPKKSFFLYMAFIWIWYTFLVRTMYQASLINSLKTNVYESNVDSIEDMLKEKYKFGGGAALRDYFINYPEVYDNFIGMNFSELIRVSKGITAGEHFAIAVNLEAASSLYFTHGEPYHVVSEKIVVSPTAIFFKKFSPLAEAVNSKLMRFVEAGLTDYLYRKYIRARDNRPKVSNSNAPMTLQHFTGCYAILFAGWIAALVVFICEIFFGYQNKSAFNT
ncbi:ligand-gated ion channel domain-containing protein [Phthorimaea operculella]|nr:ligand-gated ion channel domain-containing protein [Phthorimaea operculella]